MEEVEVAGIKGSNMADQIADALVTVKRQIEKRALSNEDNARDDGVDQANETRGLLKWSDSSFASYGVPSDFQTPAGNKSTAGTAPHPHTEKQNPPHPPAPHPTPDPFRTAQDRNRTPESLSRTLTCV